VTNRILWARRRWLLLGMRTKGKAGSGLGNPFGTIGMKEHLRQ
jgi:hypothetical protein